MPLTDSALDHEALARARSLLRRPAAQTRMWQPLTAAAFLAVSALVIAAAMIVSPPATTTPVESSP